MSECIWLSRLHEQPIHTTQFVAALLGEAGDLNF